VARKVGIYSEMSILTGNQQNLLFFKFCTKGHPNDLKLARQTGNELQIADQTLSL
jgi:hypothetical protein